MFYRTVCRTRNSYQYQPIRTPGDPCTPSSSDSSYNTSPRYALKIEFAKIFIPGMSILDVFCTLNPLCPCGSPPAQVPPLDVPGDSSDNVDSADSAGVPCEHSWTYGMLPTGCESIPFNPDLPPLWFVQRLQQQACHPSPLGIAFLCGQLTAIVAEYPTFSHLIPPRPSAFLFEWDYVLQLWQQYGQSQLATHCLGIEDPDGTATPPLMLVHKAKIRLPVGSRIVDRWCEIRDLDEDCGCTETYTDYDSATPPAPLSPNAPPDPENAIPL